MQDQENEETTQLVVVLFLSINLGNSYFNSHGQCKQNEEVPHPDEEL
jgi:hypothetical protein